MTPEGKVKAKLKQLLYRYSGIYIYWPVPMGYTTSLDVLGCYRGRFFSVETKAGGKKPTLRQTETIREIERAMGRVFVIIGPESPVFDDLKAWLDELTEGVSDDPRVSADTVKRRPI